MTIESYVSDKNIHEKWIQGLDDEIKWWISQLQNKKIEPFEFLFPEMLAEGIDTKVLECGCGPLGGSGQLYNGEPLKHLHCCDALAPAYNLIHEAMNYVPAAPIEFAFSERLTEKYESEYFDIVIMHNALDHSFDPIWSLVEMLSVVKNNGTIHLNDHVNSNCRAKSRYGLIDIGLHNWNIDANDYGNFILWNDKYKVNCAEVFSEIASFATKKYLDESDGKEKITTVIKKHKPFSIKNQRDVNVCALKNLHLTAPPFTAYAEVAFSELFKSKARNFPELNTERLLCVPANFGIEVSRDKPTVQSSVSRWQLPGSAVSGKFSGKYSFHTEWELNPWWIVDLQYIYNLDTIKVFNCQQENLSERARQLDISLSSDTVEWQTLYSNEVPFGGILDGLPLVVKAKGNSARFVRLQLRDRNPLHLDQVQIFAVL